MKTVWIKNSSRIFYYANFYYNEIKLLFIEDYGLDRKYIFLQSLKDFFEKSYKITNTYIVIKYIVEIFLK